MTFAIIIDAACPNNCSGHGNCSASGHCSCSTGWTGEDCSVADLLLRSGSTLSSQHVDKREWMYYHTSIVSSGSTITYDVSQTGSGGDCDLYVKFGDFPTRSNFDARDISTLSSFNVTLDEVDVGTMYAGVYGYQACSYSISVQVEGSCGSNCNGHGTCRNGQCQCEAGWSGEFCDEQSQQLRPGHSVSGSVDTYEWQYFYIDGDSSTMDQLKFTMHDTQSQSDCDLYVRMDDEPTLFYWDYANFTTGDTSIINISQVEDSTYHVGVYGYANCHFELEATVDRLDGPSDCSNNCSEHGQCMHNVCQCSSGYSGQDCETMYNPMSLQRNYTGFVGDSAWNYYHVSAFSENPLLVHVVQLNDGADCDVYIRDGQKPTRFEYTYLDISTAPQFTVEIAEPSDDTWYIGVYGWNECRYKMWATQADECECPPNAHGRCLPGSNLCVCDDDWAGDDCTLAIGSLSNGVVRSGTTNLNQWNYYHITTTSSYFTVGVKETQTVGQIWLYATHSQSNSDGNFPDLQEYDAADTALGESYHTIEFTYEENETWHYVIGVYGNMYDLDESPISYQIVAWSPQD
eukprot:CAMPEP_0201552778 /NCGR_PEP_ID=MMETSP0173_2-20130828/17836_1 /ASSEMBLY_ACC=CAM_ASM_000268 /TAXON_ID=218659 /ORGANISM="Vexillifera sp., Strain DIVA3 564/2" /LENGTH=572 /DNA_ID=CAMNT_0047963323 /DNA_START=78 /DNA_END=1796 /DNA_ORIENTATION=+